MAVNCTIRATTTTGRLDGKPKTEILLWFRYIQGFFFFWGGGGVVLHLMSGVNEIFPGSFLGDMTPMHKQCK